MPVLRAWVLVVSGLSLHLLSRSRGCRCLWGLVVGPGVRLGPQARCLAVVLQLRGWVVAWVVAGACWYSGCLRVLVLDGVCFGPVVLWVAYCVGVLVRQEAAGLIQVVGGPGASWPLYLDWLPGLS